MHNLYTLFEYFLHIDQHLQALTAAYGAWIYLLLFLIIFCETGLVILPLLPGDSLLFAAGSLAAVGQLQVHELMVLLTIAAILGDTVNYTLGHWVGPAVFRKEKSLLFNRHYLEKATAFYEKHGGKTIIIARFMPIIRTFAPFVAGMARMRYRQFFCYNVLGAILWVGSIIYSGYFFGTIPIIKENFGIVVVVIIALSLLPPVIEYYRHKERV